MRSLGRLILAAVLLAPAAPALAAIVYFSDCGCGPSDSCGGDACGNVTVDASRYPPMSPLHAPNNTYGDPWVSNACADVPEGLPGGHIGEAGWRLGLTPGSIDDPWCLAPEVTNADCISAGIPDACCTALDTGTCPSYSKASFRAMMDGNAGVYLPTDVAAGDTIRLCAGQCNGSGSAMWNLGPPSTWLTTRVNNLTIEGYTGESVVLSGDTDGDSAPDSGEGERIIDQNTNGSTGWTVKDVTFERWTTDNSEEVFYLNNNPSGWTFDNVEVRYVGGYAWSGAQLGDTSCDNNSAPHIFKYAGLTGTLTVQNSRFHHNCAFVFRGTLNASATAINVLSNEFYNNIQVSNDFQTRNITWRGNNVHDNYGGLGFEEQVVNVLVEDNTISCPGLYKVGWDGRCNDAISLSDGQNGSGGVVTTGVTIRRNKLYGGRAGCYGSCASGWFNQVIDITATTDTALNLTIENNQIWHEQGWANDCVCLDAGVCPDGNPNTADCTPGVPDTEWAGPAIYVSSNRNEVTVQNNSILDSKIGVVLHGATTGRAYTVRDNLFSRSRKGTTSYPAIVVTSRALNSTVQNNLIDRSNRTDSSERIAWVSTGVGGNGNYKTCSDVPTLGLANGSGNLCAPSRFTACDSAAYCTSANAALASWDLHLSSTQSAVNGGVAGATTDYDQQARPYPPSGATDIGCDEVTVVSLQDPSISPPLTPVTPPADVPLD